MTILHNAERDQQEFGVPMDVDDAAGPPHQPPPTVGVLNHEELEYVLDHVVELEGTLLNIHNDLDEWFNEFEERMEEFRAAVEEEVVVVVGRMSTGVNLLLWMCRRI